MKTIKELEKRVWEMLSHYTNEKDTKALSLLNPIARDLEKLNAKFESLVKSVDSVEEKIAAANQPKASTSKAKKVTKPSAPKAKGN